ncbi:dTDP-4-dehydrorhamnose 3,5-epimerase family protein [Amycolatopsis sp. NPDC059027]|uniref:dTDP-4-dehydrorhamnose 3,5-epimerase family protein n=1 Tax=unclassified Amycolatopsis TaxID=2618356 RepID=UPI00366BA840
MQITEMSIPDAYRITPDPVPDRRGVFLEHWRQSEFTEVTGYPLTIGQINYSVSKKNTIRGIHGTVTPPGQAKLVTCVRGAVLDVLVDLRVGSPTFGRYEITLQEAASGLAVYFAEGLGHAFLTLTDDTCVNYVCSTEYVPGTMVDIQAFDPAIGIPWNLSGEPVMSDKDKVAPTLHEAAEAGLLPTYEACRRIYRDLAARELSASSYGAGQAAQSTEDSRRG